MQAFTIPTCFFPSTALFLDDSRDFLLNFVLQLDESVAYRTFNDPQGALDYIHHKNCELDVLKQDAGDASASKLYSAIHREVYNPNRFSEISVVVVDYAMPGMNGLEFCRRIENKNIKKILLTGQADEKQAIDAFNEGLIHRYIKKNDAHAAELITQNIYELQLQYFQAMSNIIVRMLSLPSPTCLQDKNFTHFFQTFCQENGIVEYYLADECGSFLMLDDDANTSFLIVKNQQELDDIYKRSLDHGVDKTKLANIANGQSIPGFLKPHFSHTSWNDYTSSLEPAQCVIGDEPYYYTYLKGNNLFGVRQSKILSYHRYLEELDAEELLMSE